MMHLRRGGYRRRRAVAGGVAFIYFSLIGLPALFFGAAMATDFTRIIIAHRQVANAAQAAALAGAEQFTPDAASVDPIASVLAARETYCVAQASGALSHATPHGAGTTCPNGTGRVTVDVTPMRDPAGVQVGVDVSAHYQVTGLIFGVLFGQGGPFVPNAVTRSAAICLPGVSTGPTNGYCTRPIRGS